MGKNYHFQLEARDVLHSLSVPVFRLKQDAIPGRVDHRLVQADRDGEHDIQCAEICGIGHGLMPGASSSRRPKQHAAWMAAHSAAARATRRRRGE